MAAYYLIMIIWAFLYVITKPNKNSKQANIAFSIISGFFLFLLMGLRHYSVGNDTGRYLQRFNGILPEINLGLFEYEEWGFYLFNVILSKLKLSNQGYLMITSLVVVVSFMFFYYRYSKNIPLSLFLHLTIGLFTMSMSGIRQTLAIVVSMLAFHFMKKNKFIYFFLAVIIAQSIHNTAIIFLPVYFIRNLKISQKRGVLLLGLTSLILLFRQWLVPIISLLSPDHYLDRYELLSDSFRVNPMIIVIAAAIPAASILLWKEVEKLDHQEYILFSNLFFLSCLNLFYNILSLNSNMLGRLSFYFIPYITILIPNIISIIGNKKFRMIAWYLAIILPLIQFTLSTPGGSLRIDQYKFFWQ